METSRTTPTPEQRFDQLEENAPLLNAEGSSSQASSSRRSLWIALAVACVVAAAGFVALSSGVASDLLASKQHASSEEAMLSATGDDGDDKIQKDWSLDKYTIAISKGSGYIWQKTMQELHILGGFSADILGCDSIRHYGYMGEVDGQTLPLHTVESPRMDTSNPTIAEWQELFQDLHGDMSDYDLFMDNRVTMFVSDLKPYIVRLKEQGMDHMKRLSGDSDEFAHVLFQIVGNIYELVGPSEGLTDTGDWERWSSDSCAEAQTLPFSLEYYLEKHANSKSGNPIPVSFGVAMSTWAYNEKHTFLHFAESFSSATVVEMIYDSCTHVEMYWPGTPSIRVNLVNNHGHADGQTMLREYESSAVAMLETMPADGSGWTHFLDLHIGIIKNDDDGSCLKRADEMVKYARDYSNEVHFGGRSGGDATMHFYSGFKSFMTYEFNLPCSVPAYVSFCACVESNNDHDFFTEFGYSCPHFGDGYS